MLSALLPSPSRSRKAYDSGSISAGDRTYSAPSPNSAAQGKPNGLRKTIEALTGALLGVAVNQASGFLDSLLPVSTRNSPKLAPARTKICPATIHQSRPPRMRP